MRVSPLCLGIVAACGLLSGCHESTPANEQQPVAATAPAPAPSPLPSDAAGVDEQTLRSLDVAAAADDARCNIEGAGVSSFSSGALQVRTGDPLWGWVGHATAGALDHPMVLFLDGQGTPSAAVRVQRDVPREDVMQATGGDEATRLSGFNTTIPALAPATYRLVLFYQVDGAKYRCDNGRTITVG